MRKIKWACVMLVGVIAAWPTAAAGISQVKDDVKTAVVEPVYKMQDYYCPLQVKTYVLSGFNEGRTGYAHQGVDLKADEGTPVYALKDGTVIKAAADSKGVNQGGGMMIFIDHDKGAQSRYLHLSGYNVAEGDKVKAGDLIGYSGNTGDSTTPHLHCEYRINGTPIDPFFIFEQSGVIEEKSEWEQEKQELNNEEEPVIRLMGDFFVIQK